MSNSNHDAEGPAVLRAAAADGRFPRPGPAESDSECPGRGRAEDLATWQTFLQGFIIPAFILTRTSLAGPCPGARNRPPGEPGGPPAARPIMARPGPDSNFKAAAQA